MTMHCCSRFQGIHIRGLPYMMSSVGGGEEGPQKVDDRNKVAWIMYVTRGEGVQKSEQFADVIYGSPLSMFTKLVKHILCNSCHSQRKQVCTVSPQGRSLVSFPLFLRRKPGMALLGQAALLPSFHQRRYKQPFPSNIFAYISSHLGVSLGIFAQLCTSLPWVCTSWVESTTTRWLLTRLTGRRTRSSWNGKSTSCVRTGTKCSGCQILWQLGMTKVSQ